MVLIYASLYTSDVLLGNIFNAMVYSPHDLLDDLQLRTHLSWCVSVYLSGVILAGRNCLDDTVCLFVVGFPLFRLLMSAGILLRIHCLFVDLS